jgi:type II secretory pathway component PulF
VNSEPATYDSTSLSTATVEAIAAETAHIAATDMPLADGLRAAAAEAGPRQLRRALKNIAARIERGESLQHCLSDGSRWAQPLSGLVHAAQRVGEVGPMLAEWIENRQSARRHWRGVLAALAYPALSIVLFVFVFIEFNVFVISPFKTLVEDLEIRLPMNTRAIFWMSTVGIQFLGALAVATTVALLAVRLIGGQVAWSRLVANTPLIGAAWNWTGVIEMLRCLALLVQYRLPLPESLRLAAGGIADAYVAQQCRELAQRVEQGTSLTMALIRLRTLPLSIVPLVRWGEQNDCLADALRTAATMLEGRLRLRTGMLIQVVPPMVFVFVGVLALSMVTMVAGTLISLLHGLS